MEEKSKRYIGIDCSHGHGGERYKSNWRCVRCCYIKKQAARKAKSVAKKAAKPPKEKKKYIVPIEKRREYAKNYWNKNQAKRRAKKARHRASTIQRTPAWLTEDDYWMIKEAYELAVLRKKMFGFEWEVDHIIPLRGKTVSGLHVPTNLQVIPMVENRKKGASFS